VAAARHEARCAGFASRPRSPWGIDGEARPEPLYSRPQPVAYKKRF
jgi:hypothetical protein